MNGSSAAATMPPRTTPKLFTSANISSLRPELFYLCPSANLSRSSTLRTFPDTVIGKESRIRTRAGTL
ncbi:hypothetical protein GCM10010103_02540 [Streptomyces paradoxus]